MEARKQVRVLARDLRWAVLREGTEAPHSVHDRRDDAVRAAREIAQSEDAQVIVFGLDGRPQPESDPAP